MWLSNFPNTTYYWLLCHKLIEIYGWTYFWALYSVPLICMSVLCQSYTVWITILLFSRSVVSDYSQPAWTAAQQASLSFTTYQSLLKLMSIKSVMPSNHVVLCHPLLLLLSIFPSIRVFSNSWFYASGGQSIGASGSASPLPMNIQGWFPLGLTGLISLLSKCRFYKFF